MTFIESYFSQADQTHISVSAEQGSDFAKKIAGDFNPIHNPEFKRFCVPGDLLFAIALSNYGLHRKMAFDFKGLIGANRLLNFPQVSGASSATLDVLNDKEKLMLHIEYSGGVSNDVAKIEQVIRNYVAFSGHNFPHIMVPLLKEQNVMINPARPLVIYENMSFEIETFDFSELSIELDEAILRVNGKRGNTELKFSFNSGGEVIGCGSKNLVISGLCEYEEEATLKLVEDYVAHKKSVIG